MSSSILRPPVPPEPDIVAQFQLVTLAEAARRVGLARKTLYEWKRTGKLRREHGLLTLGPRAPRLEWNTFKRCIEEGGLS